MNKYLKFLMSISLIAQVLFFNGTNAMDKGIQIIDEGGKIADFSKPHTRIITLYGAHTEVLVNIGAKENLIGIDKNSSQLNLKLPEYSYKDNIEKFITAKPDLILIRPMIRDRFSGLVKAMIRAGLTVVTIQPAKFEELDNYWLTLGVLSGHKTEAIHYTEKFHKDIKELVEIASRIPKNKRKTVYYESIHKKGRTTAPNAMPSHIMKLLNIKNIAHDAKPTKKGSTIANFPKELLLSRGDDIDIYISQHGPMNKVTKEQIKAAAGYGSIKAVRDNEIYIVEEAMVSRPTAKLVEGVKKIGHIVYSDYF